MNAIPELIGHDGNSGRDLFFLQVSSPADLVRFREPGSRFACLLAWDATGESVDAVARVAEQVLASGCVYLCAWGPGCERVHDIFDEVIVGDGSQEPADDSVVMTTWHADEPLDEAIWFFLRCTSPVERFTNSCRSSIAIVVGDREEWRAAVRQALTQPAEFARRIENAPDWEAIDLASLERQMAAGLEAAGEDLTSFYHQVARAPAKWDLHPWGDRGGGFWVVAVHQDRVLWFNDIEDGFNVSTFEQEGRIPGDQYWCNQDEFPWALRLLRDGGGHRFGPPRPLEG